jgi:hypothetical protein
MLLTNQGMRNFMQNGVQDFGLVISPDEMNGQLDSAVAVQAQAQRPLAPVERERPARKAVEGKQLQGNPADLTERWLFRCENRELGRGVLFLTLVHVKPVTKKAQSVQLIRLSCWTAFCEAFSTQSSFLW